MFFIWIDNFSKRVIEQKIRLFEQIQWNGKMVEMAKLYPECLEKTKALNMNFMRDLRLKTRSSIVILEHSQSIWNEEFWKNWNYSKNFLLFTIYRMESQKSYKTWSILHFPCIFQSSPIFHIKCRQNGTILFL